MNRNTPTPKKLFTRILPTVLAIAVVVVALAALTLLPVNPTYAQAGDPQETAEALETAIPTQTPIPQEWVDNLEQTTGIVAGAVILAVIIIGGTLHTLAKNRDQLK
jgi:hypothetical protein